jgi:hypothetical protein
MEEQGTHKPLVVGSTPALATEDETDPLDLPARAGPCFGFSRMRMGCGKRPAPRPALPCSTGIYARAERRAIGHALAVDPQPVVEDVSSTPTGDGAAPRPRPAIKSPGGMTAPHEWG